MTDDEIESRMAWLARDERKITNEILRLICLAEERQVHIRKGYPTIFEWLTLRFGYSEGAANRRIQAARLLKCVPSAMGHLEAGTISLTTISRIQRVCKAQEKATNVKVTDEQKAHAVEQVKSQSSNQAERTLLSLFPEAAPLITRERVIETQTGIRIHANLTQTGRKNLNRVKEILSHSIPEADYATVIEYLAKEFLKKHDPLLNGVSSPKDPKVKKRPNAGAAKRRIRPAIRASIKRAVIRNAQGKCQYMDPKTGKVCGSTFRLQIDHIKPVALGGTDEISNLRCLCRPHNIYMSEKLLGKAIANKWRNRPSSETGPLKN